MAEALVSATAEMLLGKLLSMATDNMGLILGFKKDLEALRGSVEMIQAVIADAEEKQVHQRAVKRWLKNLEEVAYEADNLLDELNYEMLRRRVHNRSQLKVCLFFSFSKISIAFRWRMARKVRDITMKLKLINEEANSFGLQSRLGVAGANTINVGLTLHRETDSVVKQTVVGRAEDASKIVEKLLSSSSEVVSYMPITGMGGLGKTTLAQLVYNDVRIESHFGKRIWICVSDNFDVTSLFKLILESLTRNIVEITTRENIVQDIKQQLEGKRYLLVLDDVWEENSQLWSDFLGSLAGITTTKGNWSIVTTRQRQVSPNLPACHPIHLKNLSDHDCWSIVEEKISLPGDELVPTEMAAIRGKVTTICQGLPLLASVIGGLLRKEDPKKWLSIVNKGISIMKRDGNDVLQVLKFSFDHLPSSSIKKCFAYCSLFSKDTDIDKEQLIQLWMAEGFLNPNADNEKVMEDIGEDYFSILVQSSLLQEVRNQEYGTICGRMHDLVHDLAQSISKSETINLQDGLRDPNCHARYFVASSLNDEILKEVPSSLHTLFLADCTIDGRLLNFKYLRTLKLSGPENKELPTSIKKLIHLRYLDLSGSDIQAFPGSLCKLYHLETLRLDRCTKLEEFPEGMSNLVSLRHLEYNTYNEIFVMPREMGKLTCLQTLKFFNVSQEKGYRIEELEHLRNLRGELMIRNLELVNSKEEAESANLVGKPNLSKLKLRWRRDRQEGDVHDEEVMEGLQPHPNLSELEINGFMGRKFASWISMNTVPCNDQKLGGLSSRLLKKLQLRDCERCTEIPTLGHLPFLEHLYLQELDKLTCIWPSFYYYPMDDDFKNTCASGKLCLEKKIFPSLKSLKLHWMPNLMEWKEPATLSAGGSRGEEEEAGGLIFPKLEELIIEGCPKLRTAPSNFPSLKELRIEGVENLLPEANICSKVTTLVRVTVGETGGFKCFGDVVLSNNTNLLSLELSKCPDLTYVRGRSNSLNILEINFCENLRELPEDLFKCTSLEELRINVCPSLESIRVPIPSSMGTRQHQHHHRLQKLSITECTGLKSVRGCECECELGSDDDQSSLASTSNTILLSLQILDVAFCYSLESFAVDVRNAPSLSSVDLRYCLKLMTMPKISSTFPGELWIGPVSEDFQDWSELSSLSSLSELRLFKSRLPHDLQPNLTSLNELTLYDLEIEALPDWFGNLASLEKLRLYDCQNLRYLPSLEAMKRLTKLHYLEIDNCPLLKERCRNSTTSQTSSSSGTDSEWSKISHIPRIQID